MDILLAIATVLSLWHGAYCHIPDKATLTVKNPSKALVTEHVYFDVKIFNFYKSGEDLDGRFVIAVFGDLLPMTALNFISLAKGYMRGKTLLSYNNTQIHRIVPDFVIQMGDVNNKLGQGGTSIYGDTFRDEGFLISHASAGIVSMANKGKDTNNSQFFITLQTARYLDGHHVAFGKVIAGMDLLRTIGEIQSHPNQEPREMIFIRDCGVQTLGSKNKYNMTDLQLDTQSDDLIMDDIPFNFDDTKSTKPITE